MLSIIKTAIITITLSFISGVLLDHYKNIAPRIICNIGRGRVLRTNNKKTKVYFLTIRNISKKTLHNLNVNIQALCNTLNIDGDRITNGLSYDLSNEGNIYNIAIPFLSKNDEFTVKVLLEDLEENNSKPVINLRSPENFKRIDSFENKYRNIAGASEKKITNFLDKYLFGNKKVIIGIVGVLVIAFIGITTADYYNRNIVSKSSSYNGDENISNDTKSNINTKTNTNIDTNTSENKNYTNKKSEENLSDNNTLGGNSTESVGESSNQSSKENASNSNTTENTTSDVKDSNKNSEENKTTSNSDKSEESNTNTSTNQDDTKSNNNTNDTLNTNNSSNSESKSSDSTETPIETNSNENIN